MADHFDDLETRSADEREASTFEALRANLANAMDNAPFFARLLKDISADDVRDRAALAKLPVTRKSDLLACRQTPRRLAA